MERPGCVLAVVVFLGLWFGGWLLVLLAIFKILTTDFTQ